MIEIVSVAEDDGRWRALLRLAELFHGAYYPAEVNALFALPSASCGVLRFIARRGKLTLGGVALVAHADGSGEIKNLFIRPEARRAGIAVLLLDRAEQAARDHDLLRLQLETSVRLGAAIDLYLRLGFVRGERFGDYPDHPDSVFMSRRIAPAASAGS